MSGVHFLLEKHFLVENLILAQLKKGEGEGSQKGFHFFSRKREPTPLSPSRQAKTIIKINAISVHFRQYF
ncbi:unnamed protein product [Meloidogyne enterolobii]|uniref:Uncharacterized protein n=1 Tax=Meloidogyne enterolobii TaxID=390850 RepID=A0ACB1AKI4_MELEN